MTHIAPHGAWESPITSDLLTRGAVGLFAGVIHGGVPYWTESRADEGGRCSIWTRDAAGTAVELTPGRYVRTMVHEYGGGAWAVGGGIVVYSTFPDHRCYAVRNGTHTPLTPADGALRYADFHVVPDRNVVLAVREDHRESDIDCVNEIVALRLDSDNPDGGNVLVSGADFYSSPRLSDNGTLAWVEWDHPHMPWDVTRLMLGRLDDANAHVADARVIAGGESSAPCYPAWQGDELTFLDDPSGFWNFHRYRDGGVIRLHDDPHDFCPPHWVFGSVYALLNGGRIVATRFRDGAASLALVADGTTQDLGHPGCCFDIAQSDDDRVLVVADYPDRPSQLEVFSPTDRTTTVLRTAMEAPLAPEWVSVPQARRWEGADGPVHAWYYPPTNPDWTAPEEELPPLKVLTHGGPTGMALPSFRLSRQYWTSRGWAVLDVNYGGSSGFGRRYRERLRGQWGVVDVRDCCDGASAMVDAGLADPRKLAIEGGSAGGFTTLAALTTSDVFTAGNCLYGIGDLSVFAGETHKFESRYMDGLLGGSIEEVPDVYRDRSPIHHLDRLSCPMLIQQGADDRVVPPNQATLMADAVRAKGLPVRLLVFDGEGHGWRRAETIRASVEAGLSFFGQVYGYEPPSVPKLAIDNLD